MAFHQFTSVKIRIMGRAVHARQSAFCSRTWMMVEAWAAMATRTSRRSMRLQPERQKRTGRTAKSYVPISTAVHSRS